METKIVCIEIGSWHGRSSRAIADNLPKGGRLFCVDTWKGSDAEQETNHASAKLLDGDHAFDEFLRNLWDLIEIGKIIPLRMKSKNAAKLLLNQGIRANLIFIDGGHQYQEVQEDIFNFLPLRREGCLICGHDFKQGLAPSVTPAVLDIFGSNVGHAEGTTIWYTDSQPLGSGEKQNTGAETSMAVHSERLADTPEISLPAENTRPAQIFDCFTFFNELELLEVRLNELHDVVDRFVIVEAVKTHQGNPKPLYFQENLSRFEKFLHKITSIVIDFPDEMETGGGPSFPSGINWARERRQREAVMQGLTNCKDNDIIIVSDGDEIARAETIKTYRPEMGLMRLEQKLYYYNFNCLGGEWRESKILPYGLLKQLGPCNTRYSLHTIGTHGEPLWNAGWHFSFMGGVDRVLTKIHSYSHGEYNTPEITDRHRIEKAIAEQTDVFGRDGFEYQNVEVDKSFPKYIQENVEKFKEIGWIKE